MSVRLLAPILLTLSFLAACSSHSSQNPNLRDNSELLVVLDSMINSHDMNIERKETAIDNLRTSLEASSTDAEKLAISRHLYDEYEVFNPDSALLYASMAADLAARIDPDNYNLATDCLLNKVFIYITQGFFDDAIAGLESINSSLLDDNTRIKYFQICEYAHSMQAHYSNSNKHKASVTRKKANAYLDSMANNVSVANIDWLWVPIARGVEQKGYTITDNQVNTLLSAVNSSSEPTRKNAINAYWLSRYYESVCDTGNRIKYLTLASIYDAVIENREIAALSELAEWLYENGDKTRAYNYILYSNRQANAYHNRNRLVGMSDIIEHVRDDYNYAVRSRDMRMRSFIIILSVLSLVLVASIAFTFRENRRLRKARAELALLNDQLRDTVADRDNAIEKLEDTNRELLDANNVKRAMLTLAFRLTSDHINVLDDYRKKLLRKYRLKQYNEVGVLLDDSDLLKDRFKNFYEGFDATILSIFPNFVNEYNASVPDDAKVDKMTVEKNKSLKTRMRIYALRRLGVDKSADIASMLNISIRTVYNNRDVNC